LDAETKKIVLFTLLWMTIFFLTGSSLAVNESIPALSLFASLAALFFGSMLAFVWKVFNKILEEHREINKSWQQAFEIRDKAIEILARDSSHAIKKSTEAIHEFILELKKNNIR